MSEFASRALLARLIGFATVSRDSNLALIGFIRDYLAELGVACELFHNPEGTKANLFATIGPRDVAVWCCPGIPMWCRWMARPGRSSRLPW
jgi:acetylornithine deacetylase